MHYLTLEIPLTLKYLSNFLTFIDLWLKTDVDATCEFMEFSSRFFNAMNIQESDEGLDEEKVNDLKEIATYMRDVAMPSGKNLEFLDCLQRILNQERTEPVSQMSDIVLHFMSLALFLFEMHQI